MTFYIGLVDL